MHQIDSHPVPRVRTETEVGYGKKWLCSGSNRGREALRGSREERQEEKIPCCRCGFTSKVVICVKQMPMVNKTLMKPCRRPVNCK